MKLAIFFFLMLIAGVSKATSYYFSTQSGDDNRTSIQATNPLTPWKTLRKLNAIVVELLPGDSILLNSGEVYEGFINLNTSGTSSFPIIITSYGTGAKPLIDGFATLSSWSSMEEEIYQADCLSCKPNVNMVVINGVQQSIGRYPNTGYLTFESCSLNTSITDNQLDDKTNWTGAEVVIRKNSWIIDRNVITSHVGSKLTYLSGSFYEGIKNYGYFIQNSVKTLDRFGEWCFDPVSKSMKVYFGSSGPGIKSVKASTTDTAVYVHDCNNIIFEGLSIQGANTTAFQISHSNNIIIRNCDIQFSGRNAITAHTSASLVIENSTINHTNNNAISLGVSIPGSCPQATIRNNVIKNTGMIAGMGNSGDGTYQALFTDGANALLAFNRIDSTGYNAINFSGDAVEVRNNFISNFTMTKDDGGGIYTYNTIANTEFKGSQIERNIIMNGPGATSGTVFNPTELKSHGIYIDNASYIDLADNTVSNCVGSGLFLHNAREVEIKNNTFFANTCQVKFTHNDPDSKNAIRNIIFKNNKLLSKSPLQKIMDLSTIRNDIDSMLVPDSNYYSRPFDDDVVINTSYRQNGFIYMKSYNLSSWKTVFGKDKNSKNSPKTLSPYTLNSILGSNRFSNEFFNTGTNGTSGYNDARSISVSVVKKLDENALQVSFNKTPSNDVSFVALSIDAGVVAGKNYVLNFTSLGTKNTAVRVYLRKAQHNVNLSTYSYKSLNRTRTENEIVFTSLDTEPDAVVIIEISQKDSTLWLDNVRFYVADVSFSNPDDSIRWEYNSSTANRTIHLDQNYLGVDSQRYSGNVEIPPFESLILIQDVDFRPQLLPQRLLNFKAKRQNENRISLLWETANEIDVDYYEVQKSLDGVLFNSLGRVKAVNSHSSKYTYLDKTETAGMHFYRLKISSLDNTFAFSEIINTYIAEMEDISLFPNPSVETINLSIPKSLRNHKPQVLITTMSGVNITVPSVNTSDNNILIDISLLREGVYNLKVLFDAVILNKRFVKL